MVLIPVSRTAQTQNVTYFWNSYPLVWWNFRIFCISSGAHSLIREILWKIWDLFCQWVPTFSTHLAIDERIFYLRIWFTVWVKFHSSCRTGNTLLKWSHSKLQVANRTCLRKNKLDLSIHITRNNARISSYLVAGVFDYPNSFFFCC